MSTCLQFLLPATGNSSMGLGFTLPGSAPSPQTPTLGLSSQKGRHQLLADQGQDRGWVGTMTKGL